jgi:nitroimidazol reductase NimA-like FMN-containing flavoprotein (pyridoxamine 5'-phosphate oxidase superfamily)
MGRKDELIGDAKVIERILREARVCRLGLCEDDRPYVVPLCFGYEDNALYFHCGSEGRKIDILRKNNNVCFEVDVDHELIEAEKPCKWTMKGKSVIGFGTAVFIEDIESKRKALDIIMHQYSEGDFDYADDVVNKTTIVKIEIGSMTGRQSA